MVQKAKLKFTHEPKWIFARQYVFFYCLLNSSHKLMLMKILRAVVEYLISTVFTCMCSFLSGLTNHSQLKCFERQSLKRPLYIYKIYINVNPVLYIAVHYNKDQQLGARYTRQIIAICVQNILGRFIGFLFLTLYISFLWCHYFVSYFCFFKQTQRSGRENEVYLAATLMKMIHGRPVQTPWW